MNHLLVMQIATKKILFGRGDCIYNCVLGLRVSPEGNDEPSGSRAAAQEEI